MKRLISEETRKRISESKKGKPALNKGQKMTEEAKAIRREKMEGKSRGKGVPKSDDHRQKISESKKGKRLSETHRAAISESICRVWEERKTVLVELTTD